VPAKCHVEVVGQFLDPAAGPLGEVPFGQGLQPPHDPPDQALPMPAAGRPDKSVAKSNQWPQMRDELFAAGWDLLLCSAGSLSAILCEHARLTGRRALDVGAVDQALLGHFMGSQNIARTTV